MKYYAIEYHIMENVVCSFDSEFDRDLWIHEGNQGWGLREKLTEIEVGARFTHHVTYYTRGWLTMSEIHDIYFPIYDPPLNF